jgi:hypothetical protein
VNEYLIQFKAQKQITLKNLTTSSSVSERKIDASTFERLKWYCCIAISLKYFQNCSESVLGSGFLARRAFFAASNASLEISENSFVIVVKNDVILWSMYSGCFVDSTTNLIPCVLLLRRTRQSTRYPCCSCLLFCHFHSER